MILICRLTYTPVSALWASPRNIVHLRSHHRQRRIEPEHQQASVRQSPRPENHLHDSYRRFLPAHRRLALHLRNPCQDRRRRRCDGCDAGCNGYFGLRASFGRCRQLRKSAACHQIYYEQTGHERIQRAPHPRAIIYSILTESRYFSHPERSTGFLTKKIFR